MSAATPLFSPTLDSVQKAFDHWRATRNKRTRTPVSLQKRALALRETHPASHICSALKINDAALKRWAAEHSPIPALLPSPPARLVELPIESLSSNATGSSTHTTDTLTIDLGDAIELRVHGHFTLEQILLAVRQHKQGART